MWKEIYDKLMGGFENIENTDDEEEEEEQYSNSELTNDGYLKKNELFVANNGC